MKNLKYLLLFFILIFSSPTSYSQSNIATLDVVKLLKDSKAAISMKDQLNAVAKKYSEEDQKKQKEIQKQEEELLRQKSTLTPEAFSDRKNTFSSSMNSKVSIEDKNLRRKKLQMLSNKKYKKFINKNLSTVKQVLFENYNEGFIDGLSENYIRVFSEGDAKLVNSIKEVQITEHNINTYGKIIN